MTKKIGIDARLWNETGVGRYIRNLVSELQKIDKENKYTLFVRSQDKEKVQVSIFNNQWSIKTTDIHWHTVQEQLQFGKFLEKENLDLVHFPYFSVPVRYSRKFVLTIHDLILHQFPTGKASTKSWFVYQLKHSAYKYIIARAAKKAEKIITVSESTKEEIVSRLKADQNKIVVTYEGVDGEITNPKSQVTNGNTKYKIPDTKYFLYVGNAYPHKNLERLVEGFELFVRHSGKFEERIQNQKRVDSGQARMTVSESEVKLILVGKEDFFYKRLQKKVSEMGLGDYILFKHSVTDVQLASLYSHALALIMPSLMEGFGLPVLEAMAQNCLVGLSDIPVFHEIAEDSAIYFNPQDVQDIKNVLESIAKGDVPDETEKKKKGKEISKKFSWEKMAQETLYIYQSCLGI